MPQRYVLGGAAIAAVTYYFYNQREQQRLAGIREGPAQRTGRKVDEAAGATRDKFQSLQDEASRKIDTGIDKISAEGQRAQDSLQSAYESGKESTKQLGRNLKQGAIDAKDATKESLAGAKDAVVGREDDLARRAQRSLEGWSETAQQNADAYYDSLHTSAESSKSSLFGWGSRKRAESERALTQARDDAQKLVDDAQKKFAETKASWFSFQDEEKKRLHEEASKRLDSAKANLASATDELSRWKADAKNALKKDTGFYSWLRGDNIAPEKEQALAHTASRSLRGWGESAEQFAREEEEETARRLGLDRKGQVTTKALGDSVPRQVDSWSKWANKKYSSDAKGAQEYYNDAQQALEDAQKEVEDSANSWYKWGSKKSKQLEEDAKKNLEDAQNRAQQAGSDLSKWGIDTARDVNKKLWAGADDALQETKRGVDSLHDHAKEGLNDAQRWVKDQKH